MIVPFSEAFNKESSNDIYGVINLNIVRKEKSFSDKDIALVRELVNLVSVALVPFRSNNSPP